MKFTRLRQRTRRKEKRVAGDSEINPLSTVTLYKQTELMSFPRIVQQMGTHTYVP